MARFDPYEQRARLLPGLLAYAPIAVAVATLGFQTFPAVAILVALLSAAGSGYVLTVIVRELGLRTQARMWSSWGGPPTTRYLRTRERHPNSIQHAAWREAIQVVAGVSLLSPGAEARRPTQADETIALAVGQARLLGQDPRYPLVKAENAQYGFERNLFGFRWVGRTSSFLCTAVLAGVSLAGTVGSMSAVSMEAALVGMLLDLALLVGWVTVPSATRTRAAADRYAECLFQAVLAERRLRASVG